MDSEKKFKLDELPEEGSSSFKDDTPEAKPAPKTPKEEPAPRVKSLQGGSDSLKAQVLGQKWYFDKPEYRFGWLIYVGALIVLQKLPQYHAWVEEMKVSLGTHEAGELLNLYELFVYPLRFPVMLTLLTPFFFRFKVDSEYWFEIAFDGVSTVRTTKPMGIENVTRVFIKWDEIIKVERSKEHRPVLVLSSPDGRLGEIIWDLSPQEQKGVAKILKGLVKPSHPLRTALEKEKL